jgi:hypothetical protein
MRRTFAATDSVATGPIVGGPADLTSTDIDHKRLA